jgi:DNA-binding transcriptional MocR family regulator
MASPDPVTHDRVFGAIRSDLMTGKIEPGTKLAATAMARDYQSSLTPVREAIYRLVGEGLVEKRHDGFHAKTLSHEYLVDLLDLNQKLLIIGLQHLRLTESRSLQALPHASGVDPITAVIFLEVLFSEIFRATANEAIIAWGHRANELLYRTRLAECRLSRRARIESASLLKLAQERDLKRLARQVRAHHRRHIERLREHALMEKSGEQHGYRAFSLKNM